MCFCRCDLTVARHRLGVVDVQRRWDIFAGGVPRVTDPTYINRTSVLRQKDSAQIATVRPPLLKNDWSVQVDSWQALGEAWSTSGRALIARTQLVGCCTKIIRVTQPWNSDGNPIVHICDSCSNKSEIGKQSNGMRFEDLDGFHIV